MYSVARYLTLFKSLLKVQEYDFQSTCSERIDEEVFSIIKACFQQYSFSQIQSDPAGFYTRRVTLQYVLYIFLISDSTFSILAIKVTTSY